MVYPMKRAVDEWLRKWVSEPDRGVLLVRGARQVGKTYTVRQLARSFDHFVEVNFEEEPPALQSFFDDSLNPAGLCEKLSAYYGTPIVPGKTLLFFDEIQVCPRALSALRFFREKAPDLHVVAAGSLLEFALAEIPSQGVGRIQSLFMYPMSFKEFLQALDEDALCSMIREANADRPLPDLFHRRLVDYVRTFQLLGGMPRVVQTYVDKRDLTACMEILDDLLVTFHDDFSKYRKRSPVARLQEVFDAVSFQAGGKFKYSNVDSLSSGPSLKDALEMLVRAGLAIKVPHTSARGLPLAAQVKASKFKVLPFDVGLCQRALTLDISSFLLTDNVELINKGSTAEVLTGLELVHNGSPRVRPAIYYWHREKRGSQAEVDYVVQTGNEILPIEVKSGSTGRMRSMHLFLAERHLKRGLRVSLENFSRYGSIETVPLYAVWSLCSGA